MFFNKLKQLQQANAANAVAEFTTAQAEKYAAYTTLKGKAAVDGFKPYLDDLNASREAIGQKLTSPYAQKIYLQESRSVQARSAFAPAKHAGDEGRNFAVASTTTVIPAHAGIQCLCFSHAH